MNLIPFIILVHGLMGIWSHTAPGIFNPSAFAIQIDFFGLNATDGAFIVRAITDILMLGAAGLILAWIIIDWILIGLISGLRECCKDEL